MADKKKSISKNRISVTLFGTGSVVGIFWTSIRILGNSGNVWIPLLFTVSQLLGAAIYLKQYRKSLRE